MRRGIVGILKGASIPALLLGAALTWLPTTGCAQQKGEMQLASEKDRGADVQYAAHAWPVKVTKHGPRRQ